MSTTTQLNAPSRYPTLQPAGAFLRQATTGQAYAPAVDFSLADEKLLLVELTRTDDPTSPTSVSATASFLASIRHGLDDLKGQEDADDSDDDDDDEGLSLRYYSSSSNNTYYAPPSAFAPSRSPQVFASDAVLLKDPLFARASAAPEDDGMIFDMDM